MSISKMLPDGQFPFLMSMSRSRARVLTKHNIGVVAILDVG